MLVSFSIYRGGQTPRSAMGRRSSHTPQQIRALILDAAQEIIEAQGLAGLSAREIARRIGYSPGTIYNMFANLDDVVLNVEARVLDALEGRLSEVETGADGTAANDQLIRIARAYLAFTQEKPRLWNLLFEHHMPRGADLPPWYQQKLESLTEQIERALVPHFPSGSEDERRRAARALWAGVHGITSLSTADKQSVVTAETAGRLIEDLIGTYLAGLARQQVDGRGDGPQTPPLSPA
jgi:AcrR family transcriptional regulator